MSRSIHEQRVGKLLDSNLVYYYKPADGIHGGPVKIDFLGCCRAGHFVMVEAKQTGNQSFYNPNVSGSQGISALQRAALDAAARGRDAHVFVAVGKDKDLFMYRWKEWRMYDHWPFYAALPYRFTTWQKWSEINLFDIFD